MAQCQCVKLVIPVFVFCFFPFFWNLSRINSNRQSYANDAKRNLYEKCFSISFYSAPSSTSRYFFSTTSGMSLCLTGRKSRMMSGKNILRYGQGVNPKTQSTNS